MPLPTSKQELLSYLQDAYEKLDNELDAVPKSMERDPQIEGDVSCCDVLAYQMGWAKLLLGWDRLESKGETPAMPADGYKWNELGQLAQSFYETQSSKSLDQLRAAFKHEYDAVTQWIASLSEDELFRLHQRQWAGEKWVLAKWIQVNTVAPYRSARAKIRRWKKVCLPE